MKTKTCVCLCAVVLSMTVGTGRSLASNASCTDPAVIVADFVVVRPLCLAVTVIGSAFYVLSLPVAATSKSVHRTTKALVVQPAKATFTRPLGEFDDLDNY